MNHNVRAFLDGIGDLLTEDQRRILTHELGCLPGEDYYAVVSYGLGMVVRMVFERLFAERPHIDAIELLVERTSELNRRLQAVEQVTPVKQPDPPPNRSASALTQLSAELPKEWRGRKR